MRQKRNKNKCAQLTIHLFVNTLSKAISPCCIWEFNLFPIPACDESSLFAVFNWTAYLHIFTVTHTPAVIVFANKPILHLLLPLLPFYSAFFFPKSMEKRTDQIMCAVAVTGVLRGVIAHWVVYGDTCQADSWQDFSFGINSMSEKNCYLLKKKKKRLQMKVTKSSIARTKKTSSKKWCHVVFAMMPNKM